MLLLIGFLLQLDEPDFEETWIRYFAVHATEKKLKYDQEHEVSEWCNG